jgi:glycosyltransferase involved in cell wall biosynthesis
MMQHPVPAPPAPILFLSRGGDLDGAQRQLQYLLAGLDRALFSPVVFLDAPGAFLLELQATGIPSHVLSFRHWRRFPEAFARYVDAFRACRVARTAAVRLVHASDLWKSHYAHYIAGRLGVPCVVHVRGPVEPRDIVKHRLPCATAIVAIARRYQEDLVRANIAPERVSEIDDSVDLERFFPGDPRREAMRAIWQVGDRLAVGYAGRVEETKRTAEFLRSLAHVPEELRQRSRFLIIGESPQASYLRLLYEIVEKHGLQGCVQFTGRCDDMPAVIAGLDVLVTFAGGSVMFEAMAAAKTVLSVRPDARHSLHTRHDQTAWCVSTLDPASAGQALARLLADESLRARLGSAAAKYVPQHLAPRVMVEKTQRLYETLLHRK